jgi:hypothetical protein
MYAISVTITGDRAANLTYAYHLSGSCMRTLAVTRDLRFWAISKRPFTLAFKCRALAKKESGKTIKCRAESTTYFNVLSLTRPVREELDH